MFQKSNKKKPKRLKFFFSPLLIVNIIGLLTILILVTKSVNDYTSFKAYEEEKLYEKWEILLSQSEKSVDFFSEIMSQPFKFYLMGKLVEREGNWLKDEFGISMEIILPPMENLPEGMNESTYEKVLYWFEKQDRSQEFGQQYIERVSTSLSFLINELRHENISAPVTLYKNTSLESYNKIRERLKSNRFVRLGAAMEGDVWHVSDRSTGDFEFYISLDRNKEECIACHGYDREGFTLYFHFTKSLDVEEKIVENRLQKFKINESFDVGIFCFFYMISLWIMQGIVRRQKGQNVLLGQANESLEKSIQEKVLAEKAVKESEQKFRAVAETAADAIISSDSKGVITAWNKAAAIIFGYEKEDVLGKGLELLIPKRYIKQHRAGMLKVINGDESILTAKILLLEALRKDGTEFPVEFSISSWRVNETLFFTYILRDITKRKQTEERIEKGLMFERVMSKLSTRFLIGENVSHALSLSLEEVGKFIDASSLFLFASENEEECLEMKNQWVKKGLEAPSKEIGKFCLQDSTLWKERLEHDLVVSVSDRSLLPKAAFREKEIMVQFRAQSFLIIPFKVSQGVRGLLVACSESIQKDFKKNGQVSLEILSGTIGNALMRSESENTLKTEHKKMENALDRAVDILSFWEQEPTLIPRFTFSSLFRTSHDKGGGDTIHLLDFRNRFFGLFVCDIAGHDIKAILLNIFVNIVAEIHKVNPSINSASSPSDFMLQMNRSLVDFCAGSFDYATAAYVRMDYETEVLDIALAAHPYPYLISLKGDLQKVGVPGDVLGQWDIDPNGPQMFQYISLKLEEGDLLLLYTDGLMEQENEEGVTFETQFQETIAQKLAGLTPVTAFTVLKEEFIDHLQGRKSDDDVSYVFIGPSPKSNFRSLQFITNSDLLESLEMRFQQWKRGVKDLETYTDLLRETKSLVAGCHADVVKELAHNQWTSSRIEDVEFVLTELCQNAFRSGHLPFDSPKVNITYGLIEDVLEVAVIFESVGGILEKSGSRVSFFDETVGDLSVVEKLADAVRFSSDLLENKVWVLFRKEGQIS